MSASPPSRTGPDGILLIVEVSDTGIGILMDPTGETTGVAG